MNNYLSVVLILCPLIQQSLCEIDCMDDWKYPPALDPAPIVKAADVFSFKLFKDIALNQPKNNLVVSPYSVWNILHIAYFGAGGNTERQLQTVLGVPSKVNSFYGRKIINERLQKNPGTTFNEASKAYFADDIELAQCSMAKLPEVERLDFTNPKAAADKINQDVFVATNGKIENYLRAKMIRNSMFLMINAVYFKRMRELQFSIDKTGEGPFYDDLGISVISKSTMMTVQAKIRYYVSENIGASVVELPYADSDLSMFLILPTLEAGENVYSVISKLTSDGLDEITRNFRPTNIFVRMPRFKMTTRIANDLKTSLENLGITDLFDAQSIDLTKFIPTESAQVTPLILHRSTIEVSEEGSVANATVDLVGTGSGAMDVTRFLADRPFIYLIRDIYQGLTLLMGVVRNPKDG